MPKQLLTILEDPQSVITPVSKPYFIPPVEKEPEQQVVTDSVILKKPATIQNEAQPATIFSSSDQTNNTKPVTAFGKTIFGKILKGAAIAGGSILGLGAVKGIIQGVGVAAGVGSSVGTVGKVIDKVGTAAVNLVTGTTKDERAQVKEVKTEAKEAADKLEQVDRLVKAGATIAAARSIVGLPAETLTTYEGETIQTAGIGEFITANKKIIMIAGGVLAALFLLPKLLKRR